MAFVEVSKEQFFKAVGGPENIHPTPLPNCSEWMNLHTREIVGRSEPGYKSAHGTPDRYWLTEQFAGRKSIAAA